MQGLASESTRRPGVSAWGVSLMTGGQVPSHMAWNVTELPTAVQCFLKLGSDNHLTLRPCCFLKRDPVMEKKIKYLS